MFDHNMVSKSMEEEAAWTFIQSHENTSNKIMTMIHPTHIMGPSFVPWHNDIIYAMLRDDRAMADSQLYWVDVRDAAAMNIALMKSMGRGHRIDELPKLLCFCHPTNRTIP